MGWLAAIVDCHRHIAIAILCIVALVLYIAATSVQDPLARFPGPWLARFTNIYAAWHAFRGDMHLDIQRCHRQYGAFVRYGPNRLLINTSKGFDQIYGYKNNLAKSKAFSTLVPWEHGETTITLLGGFTHQRRRETIRSAMHNANDPSFRTRVDKIIGEFLDGFDNNGNPSRTSDAGLQARKLTMKATFEFLLGEPLAFLAAQEGYFLNALDWWNKRMGLYFTFPGLPNWKLEGLIEYFCFLSPRLRDFMQRRREWEEAFTTILERSRSSKKNTLLNCIAASEKVDHATLPESTLWAEAAFLFLAGSDTTATTISATLFYLTKHPKIKELVEREVRATFSREDEVRQDLRTGKCPLLRACIWESLRMSTPLAGPQWRHVPNEGLLIENELVQAGCEVGASIYALHRSNEFARPETFDPDCWLEGTVPMDCTNVPLRQAFRPFGAGRRSCIGRAFALETIYVVIARTILRYNIEAVDAESICKCCTEDSERCSEYPLRSHLTAIGTGPQLKISPIAII